MSFARVVSALAALSIATLGFGTSSLAQDKEQKDRKTRATQRTERPQRQQQQPSPSGGGGGYPSCESGVLWVDSLCRRADGRICQVDENDLVNCN